jgi:DNA-binding IclR family transcriptional regulator
MACISPDGKPTESGTKMLRALKAGAVSAEEISKETGLPLFRARSGLREFIEAGLAKQTGDRYAISEEGAKLI